MHDIDFLPAECRQNDALRKWQTRRILLAALLAAMIAAAAFHQHNQRRRLEADLAQCEPAHARATAKKSALEDLQSRLQTARAQAELLTYLRHPWPRTRILAALLEPLPDEISFQELRIRRESASGAVSVGHFSQPRSEAEEEQSAGLAPATRDLKRLRAEFDSRQTVISIAGVTTESAALHRYLGELGKQTPILKAQLRSIEADQTDPGTIRFTATVIVRAGYGQPGGPSGSNGELAARTDRKTS